MKIIDNAPKTQPLPKFDAIKPGTLFYYDGTIVVKTQEDRAVDIEDGETYDVPAGWFVEIVYPDAVVYLHGAPKS